MTRLPSPSNPRHRPPPRCSALATLLALLTLSALLHAQFRIKDFRYPIFEAQPGAELSRLKGVVTGVDTTPIGSGRLLVRGMRIELYAPDATTNLIAQAPECTLDQVQSLAYSTNRLRLSAAGEQLIVTGEGFVCDLRNTSLTLSNNVETLIFQELVASARTNSPSPLSATSGTNGPIRITAHHLWFNSASNRVVYTQNVRVLSAELDINCERLTIQLGTNQAIQSIIAETNVTLVGLDNNGTARGHQAVYRLFDQNESVTLTGSPARWTDGSRHAQAGRFRFDLARNELEARNQARVQLPRANLSRPDWLLAQTPPHPAPETAPHAPSFLEIHAARILVELPTPENPGRTVSAFTNVLILDPAENAQATADQAAYHEAAGTIELTGRGSWRSHDRLVQGDRLFIDRTNKIFRASQNAYLSLPLAALGDADSPLPSSALGSDEPAVRSIEIFSDNYQYQPGLLEFQDQIWLNIFDDQRLVSQLTGERLLLFLTPENRVRRVIADRNVTLDDFPPPGESRIILEQHLQCERLLTTLSTNGHLEQIVAWKNVVAHQTEQRAGTQDPLTTRMRAARVTTHFFPETNVVERIVAEEDVLISQNARWAHGEKAVYWATNELVELSGQPTAAAPEGAITEAEVLLWDRKRNRFMVRELRARGERVPGLTNDASSIAPLP